MITMNLLHNGKKWTLEVSNGTDTVTIPLSDYQKEDLELLGISVEGEESQELVRTW